MAGSVPSSTNISIRYWARLVYRPVRGLSVTQPDVCLYFTAVLPTLLQDITNKADKWGNDGKNGRIDPFTEIYDVSFCSMNFLRSVPSFSSSARFPHDRPYEHLSRSG